MSPSGSESERESGRFHVSVCEFIFGIFTMLIINIHAAVLGYFRTNKNLYNIYHAE